MHSMCVCVCASVWNTRLVRQELATAELTDHPLNISNPTILLKKILMYSMFKLHKLHKWWFRQILERRKDTWDVVLCIRHYSVTCMIHQQEKTSIPPICINPILSLAILPFLAIWGHFASYCSTSLSRVKFCVLWANKLALWLRSQEIKVARAS